MAEAFFNYMARERHRGISAGSMPGEKINPIAVRAMKEVGIDMEGRPKQLTEKMVMDADLVVTMGCGENVCPVVPKDIIDWNLDDPHGQSIEKVREIRDEVQRRVRLLITSLDS